MCRTVYLPGERFAAEQMHKMQSNAPVNNSLEKLKIVTSEVT